MNSGSRDPELAGGLRNEGKSGHGGPLFWFLGRGPVFGRHHKCSPKSENERGPAKFVYRFFKKQQVNEGIEGQFVTSQRALLGYIITMTKCLSVDVSEDLTTSPFQRNRQIATAVTAVDADSSLHWLGL